MRILAYSIAFLLAVPVALTQQVPAPPPPPVYANLSLQLATLADQPARHTGFAFDKNMVQVAQSVLESGGLDAKRAAAAVTSIAVDQYHYQLPAFYTPEAMQGLLDGYRIAGWKHLVNANQTPASTAQPRAMVTDLWLHYSGADIDAVTVLTRASHDMNVLQLTGDLRPLDLLHLSGHFGIPKVDPDAVMVPDNAPPPPLNRR